MFPWFTLFRIRVTNTLFQRNQVLQRNLQSLSNKALFDFQSTGQPSLFTQQKITSALVQQRHFHSLSNKEAFSLLPKYK